jgi:GntR family transcriptional regulator of abcA and norABC
VEQKNRNITIDWKPNKKAKISLANQIIAYFKARVYKGDWVCGDILPSQRALALFPLPPLTGAII